jgi:signal transduction histidine kinase
MRRALASHLYVRIWLAVVFAVALLTFLASWVVRLTTEPPLRDVVVRAESGVVIGEGKARLRPPDGLPEERKAVIPGMEHLPLGKFGPGPEFFVRLSDGELLHIHLPREPRTFWTRPPYGFLWSLSVVALAVALATYPITRRLTRRLERLQHGVEQWGMGNLSARVEQTGHDEVAYLAQRFNHAAAQIEKLLVSHKSLLANASHELRTPLTRIRMGLELLGDQASPALREEMTRNIAELDELIEEILLASRLDAPQADVGTVESIDLTGLASEECAATQVALDLGDDPQSLAVPGVPRLMRRMLRNLIDNARRHGSQEDIQVRLRIENEQWLSLSVSDRGPGVPEPLRDRIFEPFYRIPGSVDGGAGLGLALVRAIAQRHRGQVRYEERAGGGSSFVVTLPREISPTMPT